MHPASAAWAEWDGAAFEALARRHGTPFFVYDADAMRRRIGAIREAFHGRVHVFYAVKANPNLRLLQALRDGVDGLDISSSGELEQACAAGYDPGVLSFAGPGKTAEELALAVERAVGCISVESLRELRECARVARAAGTRANCALRVNPLAAQPAYGLKMGGKPVPFGIDEEQIPEALDTIEALRGDIDFKGVHVYVGSQCFEPQGVVKSVEDALRIVTRIEERAGFACTTVNFGGGFGVSHADDDRELALDALASALNPLVQGFVASSSGPRKLVFELGRYVSARAGIYVARVVSAKASRGKQFFVVDGGLHHHLAAAGTFGAVLRSNFALRNLSRGGAQPVRCQIAGPSCNPTDLLGIDAELPRPEEGDLLGVLAAGSYGLTASPILFLGRRTPAEWIIDRGEVALGRAPRLMSDFN